MAAVVKADAYGLGADRIRAGAGARPAATVFSSRGWKKALRLRKLVPQARIFVLDGAPPDAVPALISHRLTPVLNSLAEIAAWSAAANVGRSMRWMRWCMSIPA